MNDVSNCVLKNGGAEFSVVYDDAAHTAKPEDRLKCLWGGKNITASGDDGETWHPFGEWTSESIDPGVSVYRDPWNPVSSPLPWCGSMAVQPCSTVSSTSGSR